MEVIDPASEREAQDGQEEMRAVVSRHERDVSLCEDAREGAWEQVEGRPPGPGPVDEVLLEALLGVGAEDEDDREDEEVLLGADDGGPVGEVGVGEAGAVDADVGEAQRVGGADGDPDGVARAGGGLRGGGVRVVGDVPQRLQQEPGGGRGCGVAGRERRGLGGGGEDLADPFCVQIQHRAPRRGDWSIGVWGSRTGSRALVGFGSPPPGRDRIVGFLVRRGEVHGRRRMRRFGELLDALSFFSKGKGENCWICWAEVGLSPSSFSFACYNASGDVGTVKKKKATWAGPV